MRRTTIGLLVAGAFLLVHGLWAQGMGIAPDEYAKRRARLLEKIGFHTAAGGLQLLVPLGLSFVTLQMISYLVDIHRRTITPKHPHGVVVPPSPSPPFSPSPSPSLSPSPSPSPSPVGAVPAL